MTEQYFTTSLTVAAPPAAVFAAINDIRGWWSEEVDGQTDAQGEQFTFHGHDEGHTVEHVSLIRVEALVPERLVVWRVLDNKMSFVADQREWLNTEIRFELTPTGTGTELRFAHVGLAPSYECYDVCSNAWSFFIGQSLRDFVESGTGSPIARSEARA